MSAKSIIHGKRPVKIILLVILLCVILFSVAFFALKSYYTYKYRFENKLIEYSSTHPDTKFICSPSLVNSIDLKYTEKYTDKFISLNNLTYKDYSVLFENSFYYVTSDEEDIFHFVNPLLDIYDDISYEVSDSLNISDTESVKFYKLSYFLFEENYSNNMCNHLFFTQCSAESFSEEYHKFYYSEDFYYLPDNLSLSKIAAYLQKASKMNNHLKSVWIIMDPFFYDYSRSGVNEAELDSLIEYIQSNTEIPFYVLLASPYLKAWTSTTDDLDRHLLSYKTTYNKLSKCENTVISFPGCNEWMLKNSALFSGLPMNNETAKKIVGDWIALNYTMTFKTIDEACENIKNICNKNKYTSYNDLSNYQLVFFGDSVIGNYKDSTGIASLTNSLCNIQTYNKAIGGTTATLDFKQAVTNHFANDATNGALYLINYGINDYFSSLSIEGDISFKKGLQDGIELIKEHDPQSTVIVVAPYFPTLELSREDNAPEFIEYVNACKAIAKENGCCLINNYIAININKDTELIYLHDQVHLNESGRLKYAKILVSNLERWLK